MNDLQELLNYFVANPEEVDINFKLGNYYNSIGQTASAISYYIRTSERTDDKEKAYSCLLAAANCFDLQGCRSNSVKGMLQNAISLLPSRPEAYFLLSRFYERQSNYQDSYMIASIGETFSDRECVPLNINVGYPGFYGIIFEKAVSAWHCGLCDESCRLHYKLKMNKDLDEVHRDAVDNNINNLFKEKLGKTFTSWHDPIPYTKEKYDSLRYKFSGSKELDHNYAQVCQDLFVLSMLDGKKNGCFLEVGGARPYFGNNTALLEESFNWTGVSIEHNQQFAQEYTEARKNTSMLCTDAITVDYDNILSYYYRDTVIDYLQLDIDPPNKTYEVLLKIPFDKYKFRTITYEHDYYSDSSKSYRDKSREYLESKGYVLVVDNISPDENSPFEDWWVHPDFISSYIMDKMKLVDGKTKYVEDYMFPGKSTVTENDIFKFAFKNDTVWVVDNFYENPDAIRKFALEQDYHIGGIGRGYIGNRTHQQFLFSGLKEVFEQIMGKKITKWKEHGMNGRFQYCWSGQPVVYHCDSQMWGGMIYLTPDAPFECGTTLYAHKKTRARTYNEDGYDVSWRDIPGDPHLDGTPFEPVDILGNVYNRLVIFDASCIHSASEYFGTIKENCRLWQMFFFDTE